MSSRNRLSHFAVVLVAVVTLAVLSHSAEAALSFTVDANGWPNAAHRDAAVNCDAVCRQSL